MLKRFTRYVTQSVAGMIGISVYVLADTFFISVYSGADGLAILNLILPVYGLIYAIGAMIGIGSATRYAISRAKGKNTEHYFVQSVTWSILAAVPFMLNVIFIPDKALAGCRCRTDRTWTKLCENYSDRNTILHVKLYIYCICQKRWSAFYCNDRFHQWKYL